MKYGLRNTSLKRSLKARTTGKWKRQLKRMINPFYGRRGMGWIRNPSRALYNWVYRRVTVGIPDLLRRLFGKR